MPKAINGVCMSENQKRIDCLRTLILMSFVLAPIIVSGCASSGRGPTPLMRGTVTPLPLEPSVIGPIRQDLFHEVAPMETLWRIGQIYEVDEESIQAANHLGTSTKLEIGQTLLIPNAKPARPVIPLYNTRDWSYIVVHHSGTEKGNATSIHASHRQRGFGNGLGYHFLIDNGTMGKPLGQIV
jgi:N-acetylmuramoyl-L-alanine amidase